MGSHKIKPRVGRCDDLPKEIDDDYWDSVYKMPKLETVHYYNKEYKLDPSTDLDSWKKEKEPDDADLRPARVIKKLQEFWATDVQWEYIRCRECNKVLGQRQQRIELIQVGGNSVVYCLPDHIRCLECRDKAKKGDRHGTPR